MSRYLFVLIVFVFSVQVQSRPLNPQEQLSVLNYEQSLKVMNHMVQEIDPRLLTFRQRFSFEVTKRACAPVKVMLDTIEAAQELEDQSKNLLGVMYACLSGVVNITDIYRLQSAQ